MTSWRTAAALGILWGLFGAAGGDAATLKATPSIALEETWDTNIFNTSDNEKSDFISRATPGLLFALEGERATFHLSGAVTAEAYADHHDLNTWDATKRAELSAPTLKITPGFSLAAAAQYLETNDLSQRNELGLAPIPGLPPTETLVVGRTSARTYGGSLHATYQATPNFDLGIGGGGTKTDYLTTAPGLTDSRTVSGDVSAQYRVSPRTKGGVLGSTAYTTYGDGSNSRSYSAGLTGSYSASEKTTVDAGAGMTFLTDSSATNLVDHQESPYGRLSVTYRDGGLSVVAAGSYELTGGGSFGQGTDRTNANLAITDQMTPAWSWDLSGYYQNERTAGPSAARKVETAGGTAGVRYVPATWVAIRLAGYTFKQWSVEGAGADIVRSHVLLGVTLSDTYLLF